MRPISGLCIFLTAYQSLCTLLVRYKSTAFKCTGKCRLLLLQAHKMQSRPGFGLQGIRSTGSWVDYEPHFILHLSADGTWLINWSNKSLMFKCLDSKLESTREATSGRQAGECGKDWKPKILCLPKEEPHQCILQQRNLVILQRPFKRMSLQWLGTKKDLVLYWKLKLWRGVCIQLKD